MTKGKTYPAESTVFTDQHSGASIRQITSHPSINHHPFFFVPAYDAAMLRLFFVSHRTGKPQIFCEERATGTIRQLTDRDDINEWSVYPTRNGKYVLFTAGAGAWRLDLDTLKEEKLADFGNAPMVDGGMVGVSMGTTALSWDSKYWAVPVKWGKGYRLYVINVENGDYAINLEAEQIGHPQFCPDDNDMILYIAGMVERVWVINRDGSKNQRIYSRNAEINEWITHESWLPGTGEITFVDWPHRIRAINVETKKERVIAEFNAWHAMPNWDGSMMVADTNFPDLGVHLFDPRKTCAKPQQICLPKASQLGEHWAGPFPYANGPIKVFAPQHTHVHPNFAPDNSRIVYSSDITGYTQIYECLLEQ